MTRHLPTKMAKHTFSRAQNTGDIVDVKSMEITPKKSVMDSLEFQIISMLPLFGVEMEKSIFIKEANSGDLTHLKGLPSNPHIPNQFPIGKAFQMTLMRHFNTQMDTHISSKVTNTTGLMIEHSP